MPVAGKHHFSVFFRYACLMVHSIPCGKDSIKIYERGAALKAHCLSKLKNAQLKVEQIVLNQDGEVTTQAAGIDG